MPLDILVLEDSADDAALLLRRIRKTWPDVTVRVADRRSPFDEMLSSRVDVILADFSLVDFDAFGALRILRERHLDVPVIIVTGAVGEETAARCIREGAADYLLKDRLVRLPAAVEGALERKRLREEQRRAADALESSERYYRKLIHGALDVMVVVNPDMTVRYHSPSAETLLGCGADEIDGRSIADFVDEAQAADMVARIRQAVADRNEHTFDVEVRVRARSGEWRTVEVRGRSLLDDADVGGILINARDITERKHAEAELERRATHLARSNAELEQFAYVASHDLQEPLRSVSSYTELLARRYRGKLDADADEFIAYATEGVARMQALIQAVLAYSRVSRGEEPLVATDLEDVLAEVLSDLSRAIAETEASVTHDPLPTVLGDRVQLVQLLENLIANAIKFRSAEPPRIHVSASHSESGWSFSVSDNGIGIDPEFRDRIFVLFQRLHTRDRYPGTGIGLTLCKKIVERHGGRIWVESSGAGSTFHFTLSDRA